MACLRNRQTPAQRHTHRIAWPVHVHRRKSEARLKMHFLRSAASGIVEREYCSLRPATASWEQRDRKKNWGGSGGKSDADFGVAVDAKAPFQSCASISRRGELGWPCVPLVLNCSEKSAVIFGMPAGQLLQFTAFGQSLKSINTRSLEQSKMRDCNGGIRGHQRLLDQARDAVGDFGWWGFAAPGHGAHRLQRKGSRENDQMLQQKTLGAGQQIEAPIEGRP